MIEAVERRDVDGSISLAVVHSGSEETRYRWREMDVPLAQIQSDSSGYQRPIRPQHVQRIVKEWDSLLMEPPVLNIRATGGFWCVDGQHRIRAILEKYGPHVRWRCRVYTALTLQEEALIFNMQDARVRLRPRERFASNLLRGQPLAVEVNDVAQRAGWSLDGSGNHRGGRTLQAIEAVLRVRRMYGRDVLERTLQIAAVGFGWGHAPNGSTIVGLAMLLSFYRDSIDAGRLERTLQRMGVVVLEEESKKLGRALGFPSPEAVLRTIWAEYNKSTRGAKKLDPIEVVRAQPRRGRRPESTLGTE